MSSNGTLAILTRVKKAMFTKVSDSECFLMTGIFVSLGIPTTANPPIARVKAAEDAIGITKSVGLSGSF